jgi:hypothetical protein
MGATGVGLVRYPKGAFLLLLYRSEHMKWLRRLFHTGQSSSPVPASAIPPKSPFDTPDDVDPNLQLQTLVIRFEVLIPLMQRWPWSDKDLKDWDRVSDAAKTDSTNPIAAALRLDVEFTPGFWMLALSNEAWNLESCPLSYLDQQASVFHMDGELRWPEECYSACNFDPLSWGIGVQN